MPGGGGKKGGKKGGANMRITRKIEAMAWNGDFTQVAIGVGKDIHIYAAPEANKKKWSRLALLENAHGLDISGLDWSPKSNQIVSCSHDRNAYVWSFDDDEGAWKPTLVILHISRAALCCKWSPSGTKFALGAGDKTVSVCQFDASQNWWHPKIIKKKKGSSIQHKSSVVSLAWHPTSHFLATACTDKKCRVYSVVFRGEGPADTTAFAEYLEDEDPSMGTPLFEFAAQGWVHDVAFSPAGTKLVFVAHDSTVNIVDFTQPEDGAPTVHVLPFSGLPFTSCLFHGEDQILAGGHDFFPLRIDSSDGAWEFGKPVDKMEVKEKKKGNSAMAKFQNRDTLGQDTKVAALRTKHQSVIRVMQLHGSALFTAGSDGRLQFWNV